MISIAAFRVSIGCLPYPAYAPLRAGPVRESSISDFTAGKLPGKRVFRGDEIAVCLFGRGERRENT
jgi:hypothetical protein